MAEKVMPHNIDAEQAVLGSMFLSKYAAQKCVENLTEDLFYLDVHNKIFIVLKDLLENNTPIDITTATAELDNRKWLKAVGGVSYITELICTYRKGAGKGRGRTEKENFRSECAGTKSWLSIEEYVFGL